MVVNAEPTKANKTTPGSERQSLLKNDLTGPTLLEMYDKGVYRDLSRSCCDNGELDTANRFLSEALRAVQPTGQLCTRHSHLTNELAV